MINGWEFASMRGMTGLEIINYDGRFKLTGQKRLHDTEKGVMSFSPTGT